MREKEKLKLRKKASEPVEIKSNEERESEEIKVETEFIDENITIVEKIGDLEKRLESFEYPPSLFTRDEQR